MTNDKLKEEVKAMTFEEWHASTFGSDSNHDSNLCRREREVWNARNAEVLALLEGLKVAREALDCALHLPECTCGKCAPIQKAIVDIEALLSTEAQQ